jgi:hypothetical protein
LQRGAAKCKPLQTGGTQVQAGAGLRQLDPLALGPFGSSSGSTCSRTAHAMPCPRGGRSGRSTGHYPHAPAGVGPSRGPCGGRPPHQAI